MTKTIEQRFKKIGSQEKVEDPIVIAKFFGGGVPTWYATEYDPETKIFFGYVSLFGDHNDEWGYFSLEELESIKFPPFGLGVERDMYCGEKPISEHDPKALRFKH